MEKLGPDQEHRAREGCSEQTGAHWETPASVILGRYHLVCCGQVELRALSNDKEARKGEGEPYDPDVPYCIFLCIEKKEREKY